MSAQLPKSKQNTNSVLISKRVGNGSPLPASIDFVNIYRSVGGWIKGVQGRDSRNAWGFWNAAGPDLVVLSNVEAKHSVLELSTSSCCSRCQRWHCPGCAVDVSGAGFPPAGSGALWMSLCIMQLPLCFVPSEKPEPCSGFQLSVTHQSLFQSFPQGSTGL